jgi:hypothetical protein
VAVGPPVRVACNTEVKVGDFLVLVSSFAKRASTLSDSGTLAQNQEASHDIFIGTALDANLSGDAQTILVQPDGEHFYPCVALGQAYDVGQPFGMAGTGTALAVGVDDQSVVPVATANLAVGTLSQPAASWCDWRVVEHRWCPGYLLTLASRPTHNKL